MRCIVLFVTPTRRASSLRPISVSPKNASSTSSAIVTERRAGLVLVVGAAAVIGVTLLSTCSLQANAEVADLVPSAMLRSVNYATNLWYAALWADDLAEGALQSRTICEQPIVFFRGPQRRARRPRRPLRTPVHPARAWASCATVRHRSSARTTVFASAPMVHACSIRTAPDGSRRRLPCAPTRSSSGTPCCGSGWARMRRTRRSDPRLLLPRPGRARCAVEARVTGDERRLPTGDRQPPRPQSCLVPAPRRAR